jgi:hypothetical protein
MSSSSPIEAEALKALMHLEDEDKKEVLAYLESLVLLNQTRNEQGNSNTN